MLIRGVAKWAKVTGEPHWGYEQKFKEWSIDVYVDEPTQERLKAEGLGPKLKDKGNGVFITFKRKEIKTGGPRGGEKNDPIRIVDHKGVTIQDKDVSSNLKIGNGSIVNVNFVPNEFKPGQVNANILSLQVWELVPYEGGEFPTRDDDNNETGESWEEDAA